MSRTFNPGRELLAVDTGGGVAVIGGYGCAELRSYGEGRRSWAGGG